MVHRRSVSFAVLAVLLAAACSSGGSRTASPPSTAAADGVVHVQTTEGVRLVATDGHTVLDAANAVASPGWDRVFAVDGTTLRTYDGQTGRVITEQPVPVGLRRLRPVSTATGWRCPTRRRASATASWWPAATRRA
jgi:hypothetical protein